MNFPSNGVTRHTLWIIAEASRTPTTCPICGRSVALGRHAQTNRRIVLDAPIAVLSTKHDVVWQKLDEVDQATLHAVTCQGAERATA